MFNKLDFAGEEIGRKKGLTRGRIESRGGGAGRIGL